MGYVPSPVDVLANLPSWLELAGWGALIVFACAVGGWLVLREP